MKKTLKEREEELLSSTNLIRDAIGAVESGKLDYFKVLSGQLRALICHGSRSMKPLLLSLAEMKDVKLTCYVNFNLFPSGIAEDALLFRHVGPPYLSIQPEENLILSTFQEFLELPIVVLDSQRFTTNEVIRLSAEKEGGAHYDDEIPQKLEMIRSKVYHQEDGTTYNEIQRVLYETALYVQNIALNVIERSTE